VLLLGAGGGLFCGAALPFVAVAVASALPKTRVLGRLPGAELHLRVKQYPEAAPIPGCAVAGTDSSLYYLSAQSVKDSANRCAAELDSEPSLAPDLTRGWPLELGGGESGTTRGSDGAFPTRNFCLASPNSTVIRNMQDWGFVDRLGRERLFCSVRDAATWFLAELDQETKRPVKGSAEISV
jgi:hypothetical protein